jgi:hypothetical protein
MSPNFKIIEVNESNKAVDYTLFKSMLGGLIYMLKTRPDVSFAVGFLATRATKASQNDLMAIKRVICYLRGTKDKCLTLSRNSSATVNELIKLHAWTDAAFDLYPDQSKSQYGYCFALGEHSGVVYAKSKKATIVDMSSTEAEVAAAVEATKEIMWIRDLLKEINLEQFLPTKLYCDNLSMITLAS